MVVIAKRLRKETTAKNPWIAQRLQLEGKKDDMGGVVSGEESLN